jgi:undecaprenyl-diphosphatase
VGEVGTHASADLPLFITGFLASAVSGYFCMKFLLRYLQRNTTAAFVYYRWALAVGIVLVALARR